MAVIASCLQDAVVPLSEMTYLPAERRFILVLNRFLWEKPRQSGGANTAKQVDASFEEDNAYPDSHQRTHTGLCIDRVQGVRSRNIDRKRTDQFLDLLTLQLDGDKLDFVFAGGGVIQLEIEGLSLFMQDLGESWPTQWRPEHGDAAAAKGSAAREALRRRDPVGGIGNGRG